MGKKGKKQSKMTKYCLSCSISQEPYIILVQMCRMIISPSVRVIKENYMSRHFFSFFKILIFQAVKGRKKGGGGRLKGQKMIWSSFMVHKCKKLIPLRAFFIFSNFWLFGLTKSSVCRTIYFRNHISYDFHLWYTCMYNRINISGHFFYFFKILIFGIIRGEGKRAKNDQNDKKFSLPVHHMIAIFGTQM